MRCFVECLPVLCAIAVPFTNVVKGGSPVKALLLGWVLILVSFTVFTLVIPLVIYKFDPNLSHMWSAFFPQPAIVVATMFFGWFYAGIPVLIAMGIRKFIGRKKAEGKG